MIIFSGFQLSIKKVGLTRFRLRLKVGQSYMKNESKIRARILLPVGIVIIFLIIISIFSVYNLQKHEIDCAVQEKIDSITVLFENELDREATLMMGILDRFNDDPVMQSAWINKDRAELYDYSKPIFDDIESKYDITHFYFTDIDRVNFLRVHSSDRNGDLINRYTTIQASKTGETSYGIELGPYGTFTLRVVHPWRINDEIVGFIELGKEVHHFTVILAEILDVDLVVLIEKENVDRAGWEEGLKIFNRSGNWDQLVSCVVIDYTFDELSTNLTKFLRKDCSDHENFRFDTSQNDKSYRSGYVPLYDASGKDVGDIVVFFDVTKKLADLRNLVILLFFAGVLIGSVPLTFFYFFVGKIETRLLESRRSLEDEILERKHAQDELKGSNQQLTNLNKSMIETVRDIQSSMDSVIKDSSEKIRYHNRSLQRCWEIYNCDRTNCPAHGNTENLRCWEVAGTFCIGEVQGHFAKIFQDCRKCEVYQFARKDTVNELGETFNEMITLLEDRQNSLRASEEKVRSILENAPNSIINVDRDGKILFLNRTISDMTREEATGTSIYDYILPEHHQTVQDAITKVFVTGEPQDYEVEIQSRGATYTGWHRASIGPILRKTDVIGATIISTDITERKKIEEFLIEMKIAFEQAGDGIATANLDGHIKTANKSWAKMHGYQPEELIGRHLSIFHTTEQMENEVLPFNEAALKLGFNEGEMNHVTKDGRTFPTWMSSSVLKNKDNEPIGLIDIARDITGQKMMEKALRERMIELEEFNRMATGREMKMIELKGEINLLRTQLEKKAKYEIVR